MSVTRFGVSLEENLLKALDDYVLENKFANRSQAIRHVIQKNIVEKKWKCNNIVAGAIVLIYPQKKVEIILKIKDILTKYSNSVLVSQNLILNKTNYMEVISVKGESKTLTEISDQLIAIKGIQHGKLIMSKVD